MNVLVINTCGIAVGGITTNMLEYIGALSDENIFFDIVVTIYHDQDVVTRFKNMGCGVIEMPNRKTDTLRYAEKLKKILKEKKYDVVHVHGNSATMSLELYLAKRARIVKRIAHCHSSLCLHPILNKFMSPFFRVLYTDALACSLLAGEWLFGKGNYQVLHNAINVKRYCYDESVRMQYRTKLGLSDEIVIGHVGAFNESKNHEKLVSVFWEIQKKVNAKLILVGDGEKRKAIIKKVQELQLEDKVLFLGVRDDVEKLMLAMDVFLFPSRWEGLGIALIEAQATGLLCLASDVVPKDTKFSDNIFYLNLEEESQVWAQEILKNKNYNRVLRAGRACDEIRAEGYDIRDAANQLRKLYMNT